MVTPVEGESAEALTEPHAEETTSEWGEVRDDETDIRTTVAVENDNDEALSELLSLEIEQTTSIAGVTVASGTDRIPELASGGSSVELTARKPHDVVPEWWATHLRNDERSITRTAVIGEADVAVTSLPIDLDDREAVVETALLDDLNDETDQPVTTAGGRPLFVVRSTTAEWVEATPQRGRIRVEADVENGRSTDLTLSDVEYVIDINGVTLADRRSPTSHTFAPYERRTVAFEFLLDNDRMADWWPTHVRNDERSTIERRVTAAVESDVTDERLQLGFLSEVVPVETDLLADG